MFVLKILYSICMECIGYGFYDIICLFLFSCYRNFYWFGCVWDYVFCIKVVVNEMSFYGL